LLVVVGLVIGVLVVAALVVIENLHLKLLQ
jgi:hypothetical protein